MAKREYDPEYIEFVTHFNKGDYEMSHAALVPAWQANTAYAFYKGLIQLAGALQHWNSGNAFWAEDLFASSYNLLEKYAPKHKGLDVSKLLESIEVCNRVAREAQSHTASNGTPVPELPKIRLILT